MLSSLKKAEPGIKMQVQHGWVRQRSSIERKLKNFTACATLGVQHTQAQRRLQSLPIGINSDAGHPSAPFFREGFQGMDQPGKRFGVGKTALLTPALRVFGGFQWPLDVPAWSLQLIPICAQLLLGRTLHHLVSLRDSIADRF